MVTNTQHISVRRSLFLIAQLVLAGFVVYLYEIEGSSFLHLFILTAVGFTVNLLIPMNYRLPFFVLLSFAGVLIVFGIVDGAWLVGCGLILICLCHIPFSFAIRVLALVAFGVLLAASRSGWIPSLWSSSVWPILGSMFMFRIVLYMHALKTGQPERGPWATLAYFFLLPNLVFPLFPVVDYNTFRRNYYDRDEATIYEQGMLWISRGLVHLVLYRLVYHSLLNDPVDVVSLGDLVQYMLGTFLLYLRVSGQFHLVIGLLHLFGFRLPETHHLYYLAHNFTELWRRINIYWKDFMMKVVFYPTYFRIRRHGTTAALSLATIAVFVGTWVLHSYQWFWLRGGFPVTLPDVAFWGILGGMVLIGALKEADPSRKPKARSAGWNWKLGVQSASTFCLFCFLWSLWSTESITQWLWMLGAAAKVDVKGVSLLALTIGTLLFLGGRNWDASRSSGARWLEYARKPSTRTMGALLLLVVAAQSVLQEHTPNAVAMGLRSMRTTGLNARDAALRHRGYYEQLEARGGINDRVADVIGKKKKDWVDLSATGILRDRKDMVLRDLHPSRNVVWNGNAFSTNRWGMRDKDYALKKRDDTLRIALLGPSHVMGNSVADGETFEALVEERLNREFKHGKYRNFEILNFGVDGYSFTQQIVLLEDRVFDFSPDIVIATHYHRGRYITEAYLLKIVWGGIAITYPPLRELLETAGLSDIDRGRNAVPFSSLRQLAKRLGLKPRMPFGESEVRVRWIADDVLACSLRRFKELANLRGTVPMILGLNAVIDDVPPEFPNRRAIQEIGFPVIDLNDVFPKDMRSSLRVAIGDDHPNAEGHRRIANRLYEEIVAFIGSGEFERYRSNAANQAGRRS